MIKLNYNDAECLLHLADVRQLILNRIPGILKNGITHKQKKYYATGKLKAYIQSLENDPNQITQLVTAKPEALRGIYEALKQGNNTFFVNNSPANLILRNLFLAHAYKNMDKLKLIKRVNVDTCPYCNRNYIYYLSEQGAIKPQIDHFYPTSKYPIFAVSYYNLIPSCQTCNGFGAKDQNDPIKFDLVNPYLLKHSDFKFSYKIKNISVVNPLGNKYGVEVNFLYRLDGHLTIFKLDKLYLQHSDHVLELILKSKVKYVETYRKILQDFEDFEFSDEEIDRMILGNFSLEEDLHKRPFSKLYLDIGADLGLIKIP
ncbi:hypothetical protein IDJ75_11180 [Mucilaginibacter rigui]|uniref:HNH endonuclease n=1 Tax=Mucilaginibacter rigui TaxID=534635 RepID=A0ABR7X5J1_9SPHI|nr:hypothetical protein [Mucilaginibacter rigui]MBD1385843.1 hypothetical protein [Mucilaginibacter rigui]